MTEPTTKKAVIYCRVSTKEQVEEGNSLATQEKICKDYALKNSYEIAEVFIEQGESAKTSDRPELKRLLAYCTSRKNGVKTVITYKLDRISRNTHDYSEIRLALKRYDVEIRSTSEYFEDTPAGRFMENIIANVAQFDNDVRTERCVGGMREAVREGRFVWQGPIGYENVKVAGKGTIVPDKMAPLVRMAFEEVAKNVSPTEEVRKRMEKKGLGTKKGKGMSRSNFYFMLRNELYTGWINQFKERHRGIFEPIVSEELFEQVQRVLKYREHRTTSYKLENPDFPLRRFVQHPLGKKLSGGWSKGRAKTYPYYLYHLKGMSFRKDIVENKFMRFLDQFELSEEHYADLKTKVREQLDVAMETNKKDNARLEKYVMDLKNKQSALIQKNLQGTINDQILRDQLELIDKELMHTYTSLQDIPRPTEKYEDLLELVKEYLRSPAKVWDMAKIKRKIKLQWFYFPQGVVFDGVNCRTTEICKLFKTKKDFCASSSNGVDRSGSPLNLIPQKPYAAKDKLSINGKCNKQAEKEYWEEIRKEIEDLAQIAAKDSDVEKLQNEEPDI